MPSSGTYLFSSPQSELLIRDAFERLRISPDTLTSEQVLSAERSLNFILQHWVNKGLNLWTAKKDMLTLLPNQISYSLPEKCTDILEATVRTSARMLSPTPAVAISSSGVAANAFDGNPATACVNTAPNGWIGYDFGVGNKGTVTLVGVMVTATTNLTLTLEYSNDGALWASGLNFEDFTFDQYKTKWLTVGVPFSSRFIRVSEKGGNTLSIAELYFNNTVYDTIITRISRSEYMSIPNKNLTGRPTSFYVDRQINPILYLWPTATEQYNNLFYTYINKIEDIGTLLQSANIPSRFLEALCASLAHALSLKYTDDLNKVGLLKSLADEMYTVAAEEDSERVPLRIYGDYRSGWGNVS